MIYSPRVLTQGEYMKYLFFFIIMLLHTAIQPMYDFKPKSLASITLYNDMLHAYFRTKNDILPQPNPNLPVWTVEPKPQKPPKPQRRESLSTEQLAEEYNRLSDHQRKSLSQHLKALQAEDDS